MSANRGWIYRSSVESSNSNPDPDVSLKQSEPILWYAVSREAATNLSLKLNPIQRF